MVPAEVAIDTPVVKSTVETKETITVGEPVTDNPYAVSNLLKEKGKNVFLRDFEFISSRKEIKNDRSFRSVSLTFQ